MVESLGYTAYWITPLGCIQVSRFDFERRDSEDFLLSPVSDDAEVVTDLEPLWNEHQTALAAWCSPGKPY
jgi:hypothetical protein